MQRQRTRKAAWGIRGRQSRCDRLRRLTQEILEPRILLAANGDELRTYRFAVSATEEYTAFFGDDRSAAQAEIASVVDAANDILNAELNIHLDLIDNLDIIFGGDNPVSPDPFSGAESDPLPALEENQTLLDSVFGAGGYDIGHVFGTFSGGRATLGGAGVTGLKGRGASGLTLAGGGPDGARLLDIFIHELGHHLKANHSFNGVEEFCSERNGATAYEPGSGTTIMAYPGLCPRVFADPPAGDNVQNVADLYFHAGSLAEIVPHLESLDTAGVGTRSGANATPIIDAGADYTIPAGTPFEITVSATDADDPSGESLRYTIEQMDVGPAQTLNPFPGDNGESALFRSFPPAPASAGEFTRTFPQLSDILSGTTTKGEYLPTVARDLTFRATARDGVGGTNDDDVTVTVAGGSPFRVTSLNSATTLTGGATETVTWDVAGTSAAPVSASMVDIRYSTDGGMTFPFSLGVTDNDGTHDVVIPNFDTTSARIKIAAVGNIFFDISDADFSVSADTAAAGVTVTDSVVVGERGAFVSETDTYTIALNTDPGGTVELSVSADAQSEVSIDGSTFFSDLIFTRSDTSAATITVRAKDDAVAEGPHTSTITHAITAGTAGYSTGTLIDNLVADVVDDERGPLVGVDMHGDGASGSVPMNWTEIDEDPDLESAATFTDLIREDGITTGFDLTITPTGITSFNGHNVTPTASTVPTHTPSLVGLDDSLRWRNPSPALASASVDATWSDLTPGAEYNVYVFALETRDDQSINQTVTISGAGSETTTFTQDSTDKDNVLLVNGEDGDSSRPLESFAVVATATAGGTINVNVRRDDGIIRNRIYLAGLAIQEIPEPAPVLPTVTFASASQSGSESGTMTITASLSAASSTDVTVPFVVSGTATEGAGEDFTITTSPITIVAGTTSAEITITVIEDLEDEPDETVEVTMGTPTGATLGAISVHTATIEDDDVSSTPPSFGKVFSPSSIVAGGTSTLTFTIDNAAAAVAATSLEFTDTLPGDVMVATPPAASTTCTGGTLTATSSASVISYSGGTVAAGASCTVTVDVTSSTAGSHVNTSGALTSSLGSSGTASDTLTVTPAMASLDFGDAPTAAQSGFAASYPTQLPDGARHQTSGLMLGSVVDGESDGQPAFAADGDGADEDGVRVISSLIATASVETTASFLVTASDVGKLDAWVDFNRDGDWLDPGEQLFATSIDVLAGDNVVAYTVPAGASPGNTYARFRLSTAGGLAPTGAADDGEVEDYRLTILDGNSAASGTLDLIVGAVEVTAVGSDIVIRHDASEIFRAPGSSLSSGTFLGTAADDSVRLGDLTSALTAPIVVSYDGDAGRDSLALIASDQLLDLTDRSFIPLSNIEVIDIVGASPNALTLDAASVIAATDSSNTLVVIHDEDDTVDYANGGWEVLAPIFVDGSQHHVLTSGSARVETSNTLPYQNPLHATDANYSNATSSLDALQIINFIARFESTSIDLPIPTSEADLPERYYDVNGSGTASALDALNVINFLGRLPPENEFVAIATPPAMPTLFPAAQSPRESVESSSSTRDELAERWHDHNIRDSVIKSFADRGAPTLWELSLDGDDDEIEEAGDDLVSANQRGLLTDLILRSLEVVRF